MFPEIVYEGTFNHDQRFVINYDEELALAGLPPYYVHRTRYKGDKMKNQRTHSELPIPEPAVRHLGEYKKEDDGFYFADVVIVETFEEALSFLGKHYSGWETEGRFVDNITRFRGERAKIDKDAQIAHEDGKAELQNEKTGQLTMQF